MNSQRGQAVLISLLEKQTLAVIAVRVWPLSGALAQLGERLICIQEVIGSIPIGSTKLEFGEPNSGKLEFGEPNSGELQFVMQIGSKRLGR
jgi:hypothetical protein